jgi:hypothetical protein
LIPLFVENEARSMPGFVFAHPLDALVRGLGQTAKFLQHKGRRLARMTRKQLSTLCNTFGGFLVYTLCLLSFVEMRNGISKLAVAGVFGVPALVFLIGAAAANRFQDWGWRLGVVLLSSAGLTGVVALTAALLLLSPEAQELYQSSGVNFFSDYQTGVLTTVAVAICGLVLMWRSRRKSHVIRTIGDSSG